MNQPSIALTLETLDFGARLAESRYGKKATPARVIWSLLEAAAKEKGDPAWRGVVLGWLRHCHPARDPLLFQRMVVASAVGDDGRFFDHRQQRYDFRKRAAGYIIAGLAGEGIVADADALTFSFGSLAA